MAKKSKATSYRVQKRFEVWMEGIVSAPSLEDAMTISKEFGPEEFRNLKGFAYVTDYIQLPGTGVAENW